MRHTLTLLLALCAIAAQAQSVRPGSALRINSAGPSDTTPVQTEPAFQSRADKERTQGANPANGCPCDSNSRCHHSLELNFCIDKNGDRVYIQRYWGR